MIIAVVLLGLVFGSFVNAFVWRLHEQTQLAGKKSVTAKQRVKKLSISKGRSMCPDCSHELAAKDLVPVLSWLSLGGKCRYCLRPISWQYPAVELLTALAFGLSYACWPQAITGAEAFRFVLWLVFIVGFMALAVYDLRWLTLPDKIVFPLIVLALIDVLVVAVWKQSWSMLWQPLLAAGIISGLFYILFQVSQGNWIGGGDVKLAVVLGLLVGTPLNAFLVLFFASVFGLCASIPLLIKKGSGLKAQIPFGPHLLLATLVVVLLGSGIVSWYEQLFVG